MEMCSVYQKVIAVIAKPVKQRADFECHELVPWIRKQNKIFTHLKHDILKDVIKHCQFVRRAKDDVVIRQGDIGDAMYVILRGSASIYIIADVDEDLGKHLERVCSKSKLERSHLGQLIYTHHEGFVFGDVALTKDCTRTASVTTDEETDLLVVNRDLYNRTVREVLEKEWLEKTDFVQSNPLFRDWSARHRKQMIISLSKQSSQFGQVIARQGQAVQNIYFILRGEVEISVDLSGHKSQHPELWSEIENDFPELIVAQQDPSRCRRWKEGRRLAAPKWRTVCLLSVNEHIGSLEMVMGLGRHLESATAAGDIDLLVLDKRHYERLVVRRHPQSLEKMKKELITRQLLGLGSSYPAGAALVQYLTLKLLHGSPLIHEPPRSRPAARSREDRRIKEEVVRRLHFKYLERNHGQPSSGDSRKTLLDGLQHEVRRLLTSAYPSRYPRPADY